jgi:hypothetical protein
MISLVDEVVEPVDKVGATPRLTESSGLKLLARREPDPLEAE